MIIQSSPNFLGRAIPISCLIILIGFFNSSGTARSLFETNSGHFSLIDAKLEMLDSNYQKMIFLECDFDEAMSSDASSINQVIEEAISKNQIDYAIFKYQEYYYKSRRLKGRGLIRVINVLCINSIKETGYRYKIKFTKKNNEIERIKISSNRYDYKQLYVLLRMAEENHIPCFDREQLSANCGPVNKETGERNCVTMSHTFPSCIGLFARGKFTRVCTSYNDYMLKEYPGVYPDKEIWGKFHNELMDILY